MNETQQPKDSQIESPKPETSDKGFIPTVLLCFFMGWLGAHRFYVGKAGTGILMLLTFGGFGIWSLIDFIMIICGKFSDQRGQLVKPNN